MLQTQYQGLATWLNSLRYLQEDDEPVRNVSMKFMVENVKESHLLDTSMFSKWKAISQSQLCIFVYFSSIEARLKT